VILSAGLQAGDQVVVDGQEKLKNGSKVEPHAKSRTTADLTTIPQAEG